MSENNILNENPKVKSVIEKKKSIPNLKPNIRKNTVKPVKEEKIKSPNTIMSLPNRNTNVKPKPTSLPNVNKNKLINNKIINTKILNKKFNTKTSDSAIKISFLGGLNQIGKNITLFEYNNQILIVDCGMSFPDGEMLGIDLVIPDFSYLEANRDKIIGLVITHGHEDHIGSIPYLLKKINVPIYATPLTIGLISSKLKEHRLLSSAKLNTINAGDNINLGCMNIEFIEVNHSIPDAVALAIKTPIGTIVHTGDFKIDCTPSRGNMINLGRFAEIGKEGVLLFMADSTNAERAGHTMTERNIDFSFEKLFQKAGNKRITVATFASNIGRLQQIINCAAKYGKKVAFSGRSMINYVGIAKQMKYLDIPENLIIDLDAITKYSKHEVVLITTGSQGEPMSALYRMAFSEHKKIEVGPEDFIIISATPIPGNEKTVGKVINELLKSGCEVIYESMYEIHTSGHACQEELKIMQGIIKPKYFIPVHGERRHLKKHASLAIDMGVPEKNVYVGDTGDIVEVSNNGIKKVGQLPLELVFVDGIGIGDVGSIVLRDRRHLGEEGLIVLVATLDSNDKHVIAGPDIVSRGFVYVRESEKLMDETKKLAYHVLENCANQKIRDWSFIKTKVKDELYKFLHGKTRRNPVILPIIMEV